METVHHALHDIAEIIDLIGIAIMMIGAAKFLLLYLRVEASRLTGNPCVHRMQAARRVLGGYILAALEFMIVSDVIHSVITRSMENLYELGLIVVIRTAIGYFLEKELESVEHDSESTH